MKKETQHAPIIIQQASRQPFLSIGIHYGYGGINAFGYEYTYLTAHDSYVRIDYLKKYKKHIKEGKSWKHFIDSVK